jgi:hypothetical protein
MVPKALLCGIVAAPLIAAVQPASVERRIAAEIGRLGAEARGHLTGDQLTAVETRLSRATRALEAGRVPLAVFELQIPFETSGAVAFATSIGTPRTVAEFKAVWFKTPEPQVNRAGAPGRPLVIAAIADASEARGPATYRASLPYAEDAGVDAGLYYLGESQSVGKFAEFCRSLSIPAPQPAVPLRSIAVELAAREREAAAEYERADAAGRRAFISVNVALKLARELDARGQYAGALLEYLLATRDLGLATSPSLEAARVADRLTSVRGALGAGDQTIAELFIQMAQAYTERDGPPGAAGAAIIVDRVIPAYREVLK